MYRSLGKKIGIIGVFVGLLWAPSAVHAATTIAKGYLSGDTSIQVGMAVSVQNPDSDPPTVVPATSSTQSTFAGVVAPPDDSLITTSEKNSNVYVVNAGETSAYVSTLQGEVKKGDLLVLSPLKGVFMKAGQTDKTAVATALETMDVAKSTTTQVNNSGGKTQDVKIGTVKIDLAGSSFDNNQKKNSFLVLFGSSITGKDVTVLQVVLAFLIFFILLVIEGSIIYGAISSSIISLGRNPLAKGVVYKELFQVVFIALLVLGMGLGAIYIILWS